MTSKTTWKNAEREVGRFHNPLTGRRTPLSGSNSGMTHADCLGVEGMFIEVKYRKSFALWTLYTNTRNLAKKEGTIPVVTIKEKSKKGFIDLIHQDFIDQYVQALAKNRELVIQEPTVHVFNQEMPLLFTGTPSQVKFIIDRLTHLSFTKDGILRDEWWTTEGERLASWVQVSHGFQIALYGHFSHSFTVDIHIDNEGVNEGLGRYK